MVTIATEAEKEGQSKKFELLSEQEVMENPIMPIAVPLTNLIYGNYVYFGEIFFHFLLSFGKESEEKSSPSGAQETKK